MLVRGKVESLFRLLYKKGIGVLYRTNKSLDKKLCCGIKCCIWLFPESQLNGETLESQLYWNQVRYIWMGTLGGVSSLTPKDRKKSLVTSATASKGSG